MGIWEDHIREKSLNYKWPVDRTLVISRVLIENGQVAFTFSNLVKFLRLFLSSV